MPASCSQIDLHFVWATYQRLPLIEASIERAILACIAREAGRSGCDVLAIGGMPDHVHLAIWLPTKLAPATLMQRVKGVSSGYARSRLVAPGNTFAWQDGYGAFSFGRRHRDRVIAYILDQKRHHASGRLWEPWERTGAGG